jgi:hypothetical protein
MLQVQSVLDTMFRGTSGAASRQARSKTATSVRAASKAGKKAKKKARQLCQKQVAECQTALTELCNGEPECLADLVCCDLFGQCDTTGALICIVSGTG